MLSPGEQVNFALIFLPTDTLRFEPETMFDNTVPFTFSYTKRTRDKCNRKK